MRIVIDGVTWALKDYIGSELYRSGMVMHPTGWAISADETEGGWEASAYKEIRSDVFEQKLAQTDPQYVRSGPRTVYVSLRQPWPYYDTAGAMMWEWLDKNADKAEERFISTGRFGESVDIEGFIPLASCAKEKPAQSLAAQAGF